MEASLSKTQTEEFADTDWIVFQSWLIKERIVLLILERWPHEREEEEMCDVGWKSTQGIQHLAQAKTHLKPRKEDREEEMCDM